MKPMDTITIDTRQGPMSIVTQPMPPLALPRQPPDTPPGWTTAAPDFVGVGVARAGTSWWFSLLTQHPKVAKTKAHKELHFFDHYMGVEDFDPAAYHRYFPRPPGMVAGEWTPRYMYDYWTPPMLHRAAPEAKILVILRDPVERYLSNQALIRSRGLPTSHTLVNHQFERGLYARQLHGLLAYYPRDQVLVLQYERCVADPQAQVRRTLEFIGLDPDEWQPAEPTAKRVNESAAAKPELDAANREALATAYQSDLRDLFTQFPDLDPTLWPTALP